MRYDADPGFLPDKLWFFTLRGWGRERLGVFYLMEEKISLERAGFRRAITCSPLIEREHERMD